MAYNWNTTTKEEEVKTGSKYNWAKGKTLEEKVVTQKAELTKKGLPVSVKSTRAEPTLAGSLLRGAIKPVADIATNIVQAGQSLTKKGATEAPLTNKYLGKVEGLGKIDITKSPIERSNLDTVVKSAATGLEIGSYATGTGKIIGTGKNVFKTPLKQFLKIEGKRLAKEGAITGFGGSLGYQGRDMVEKGTTISPKKLAVDTAIGTIAGPLLGGLSNKLLGKKATEVVEKKINPIITKIDNVADNALSKNTSGIKEGTTKFLKENPQEISSREVRLREVDGKIVIEDGRHTLQAAKETGITPVFKDVTSEYTGKPSEKIQSIINSKKQEVIPGVINDTPNVQSELPTSIQRVEVAPEAIARDVKEMSNYIEGFDEGTFKQWSQDLRSIPKDELTSVALGGEKTIQNTIPQTAYYAALKNIAKETNDINLSQMLANSPVRSKSGQAQVALQMADKDNLVDDLIEIKKVRAKQVGISDARYDAEAKSWFDKVSTRVEQMKKQIPTIEEVEDIISKVLICK